MDKLKRKDNGLMYVDLTLGSRTWTLGLTNHNQGYALDILLGRSTAVLTNDNGYSNCMQAISFSDYKQLLHKSVEYIRLRRHKYDVCSLNFYIPLYSCILPEVSS